MDFGSLPEWIYLALMLIGVGVIRTKLRAIIRAISRSLFWKIWLVIAVLATVLITSSATREQMRDYWIQNANQLTENEFPKSTIQLPPEFTIRSYEPERDTEAICVTCQINWESPKTPDDHKSWTVDFPANKAALIRMGWCAIDLATLDENWSRIQYQLLIDNYNIDLKQIAEETIIVEEQACRVYSGVLTGWSTGAHSYILKRHVYQEVNDGWQTYQAGEYVMEFAVNVR